MLNVIRLTPLFAAIFSVCLAQSPPNAFEVTVPAPAVGAQRIAEAGRGVAIEGGFTVVGAPYNDTIEVDSGVVEIFDSVSGTLLHTLINPEPNDSAYFGQSVAISGGRIIVGAPSGDSGFGVAYIFDLTSQTPTMPVATLRNPAPDRNDRFASAVAISGFRVVVGAPWDDTGGSSAGSAYVYDLSGNTPTVPVFTLNNPAPHPFDHFGESVAVDGLRVVVGVPQDSAAGPTFGIAHVYDLAGSTPTVPAKTLTNPTPALGDLFGKSVAISGTKIIVGAPQDDTGEADAGIAYLYDIASTSPEAPLETLQNPNPAAGDRFGTSVAISGAYAVIGASQEDAASTQGGSAFVFDVTSATPASPVKWVANPSPAQNDAFGASVAIFGTQIAIAAPLDDAGALNAGTVFVFEATSEPSSPPIVTLNHPGPAPGDHFGSVALFGPTLVVGSPNEDTGASNAGSAYVYNLSGTTPTEPAVVLPNPSPAADDNFGQSVAISGSIVVVGAPGDDTGAPDAGTVYVFHLGSPTSSTPMFILNNPAPVTNDRFGTAVAISGYRVVVGAYDSATGPDDGTAYVYDLAGLTPSTPIVTLHNPAPTNAGAFGSAVAISVNKVVVGAVYSASAYVFDVTSATPTVPIATLNNPNSSANDGFAASVDISNTRVVVGAPLNDTGATDSGIAYVYDLAGATPDVPALTLNNPNPGAFGTFGRSVAIDNTQVLIGAPCDTESPTGLGKAYVYVLDRPAPAIPVATLNRPAPRLYDRFGFDVALSGVTAVIGAPYDDTPQVDKGSVHVFIPDHTQAPILTAPATDSASGSQVTVTFTLPEAAKPGSLILGFGGVATRALTLASSLEPSGTHTFSFDPANLAASPQIASIEGGGSIPEGKYTVTLTYQDQQNSPIARVSMFNVTIDTTAPLIADVPPNIMVVAANELGAIVNYTMPTVSDALSETFLTASIPSGATFPLGMTHVIFTATDAADNMTTATFTVIVRPGMPAAAIVVREGEDAPGAGSPNGPPAGAKLSSFGVPAIDGEGQLAFSAQWTSDDASGSGIFRDDAVVAKIGGAVPGVSGATFKSFSQPVIDAGHLGFIATASGVPKAQSSMLISDGSGKLETIAQSGTAAPGTGEATFKSLKSIAVSGSSVGLLAQLTPGTGAIRTTTASDLGLWVKDGINPLVLVLREGQEIAPGRMIKTLVSFVGGNGSPGQGRGWLINDGESVQVLALAILRDKSQTVIAVPLDDLSHPVILSQSGAGGSFASYGPPAANATNQSVFLGSLTLGGDVTKANSRGIFADFNGGGSYSPTARVGDTATQSGVRFSLLKDPVLAADGGIAFPATIKGKAIKGLAAQTLWWQAPGGELTLAAQGGAGSVPVAGIPGAQWKSFPSLAIAANRGPIFTGALVPGKGGVTKATSNGLWATDFEGNLRLLVRAGVTQIDGKTVKSFTLLNANVGSEGSTRSFNDNAFVVWRATFQDKSQAIIKTEIP